MSEKINSLSSYVPCVGAIWKMTNRVFQAKKKRLLQKTTTCNNSCPLPLLITFYSANIEARFTLSFLVRAVERMMGNSASAATMTAKNEAIVPLEWFIKSIVNSGLALNSN